MKPIYTLAGWCRNRIIDLRLRRMITRIESNLNTLKAVKHL
ncbi:MAG: hypothetical protein ACXWEY_13115 [Bacteroidia bacterium]